MKLTILGSEFFDGVWPFFRRLFKLAYFLYVSIINYDLKITLFTSWNAIVINHKIQKQNLISYTTKSSKTLQENYAIYGILISSW